MNNDFSKLTKEEKNMWLFEEQKKPWICFWNVAQ